MTRIDAPTQWFFTAIATDGGRKRGVRLASDESSLADALREDGLLLLSARRLPAWTARTSDLPIRDQAAFNAQLATLLQRGVPLVEALEVAGSVVSARATEKVERIRGLVQAGASFADACAQVGGFDEISVTVYRAAERTGDLGDACKRLAISAQRRRAIATKATTLMIYPSIVATVSILIAVLVLTVVVPRIGRVLRDSGMKLPWFTTIVIDFGEWLRNYGLFALLALVLIGIGAWFARAYVFALLLRAVRVFPPAAKLALAMESTRFFAVMGAMTRSGVPLSDALAVACGAVSHPELREQLETVRRRLVEGGLLRTLIEQVEALPLATRRLLIAAERSGDLDAAFDGLAEDLSAEVDKRSERLLAAVEPALIIAMFMVIGSLLLSIMVPLLSITSSMEQ